MAGTVKENLIAAKALIDTPEKWIKGKFGGDGCYCARGAVGAVVGGRFISDAADTVSRKLAAYIPGIIDPAPHKVANFNDHPDTTHADVMALFDRAIAAQDGAP